MCCDGGCNGVSGNLLYAAEKLVSFCALTTVVFCIVITIAITLGVGIGLGYNYCYVDNRVLGGSSDMESSKSSALRTEPDDHIDESNITMEDLRRTPTRTSYLAESTTIPTVNVDKNLLTIPLHAKIDFAYLIEKLRARNKNVTLQLVA